jgi:glycosyltransferase involved in cell wall biosynthesis
MRILLISRCPPYPLHLGDRLIIYHLARELSQRGHEIDLLAFANRNEDWEALARADTAVRPYTQYFRHVELFAEPERGPLDYLRRALFPAARWPRTAEQSWSPEMWRAIEDRIGKGDLAGRPYTPPYDVVHLFGGVHVYEFRHALGDIPAIIVPYESYSLYLRRAVEALNPHPQPFPRTQGKGETRTDSPSPSQWRGGWGMRLRTSLQLHVARQFERWMFAPYRRVVVVSPQDRDELLALNPELKVSIIPNGVDLSYFHLQNDRREPASLLFVGNYEYAPNVDAALRLATEILPRVRAHVPNAHLWLVGHAPPPAVQALSGEAVTVTGSVPDVRPYLARATVFVSPLRLGAGIKNKVLEALAMGCPVVATPLSVDGIDARHERDVLVADADALADSVVRVLKDADLQRRLSANGRQLIEARYSWSRVVTRYEELYEAVCHVGN